MMAMNLVVWEVQGGLVDEEKMVVLKALRGNAVVICCLCCGGLERQNVLAI